MKLTLIRYWRYFTGRCLACGGKLWTYSVSTRVCTDCGAKHYTGF